MGTVQSGDYSNGYRTAAIGNDTTKYHVTDNTVVLTGTHVADDGTETEITKTVKLTNDWYGTTRASIDSNRQRYDINSAIDEENQKLNITFRVYTNEIDQKLILNKNHIEGELPLINGYAPTSLSASNANVALTYDEDTRRFTAEMESVKDNKGVVTSTLSRNTTYTLTAEYPLQAYTELGEDAIAVTIPVSTFYLGYNNPQPEYENPYKSNVASTVLSVIYRQPDPPGDVYVSPRVEVELGTYNYSRGVYIISKELPLNLYNQVETENEKPDRYSVRWYISTGTQIDGKALTLKETPEKYTDRFLNTDNNYEDMLRYVNNVGIYFSNPQSMLGEDGYINVYDDETNELIHKFTKSDWTSYSSSKPYMYEAPLKHIRIETSNASKNSSLYVYNVKEIDDVLLTAEYEKVDYDKLCKIYSYVTGYTNNEDGTKNKIRDNLNSANYEAPYSSARIAIDPNHITNQETKKNVKLKITTDTAGFNSKKWQNGEFLIKYPEEIVDININSIVPTDKNITITAVDTFEENGTLYTKIYTSNDVEKALELNIDVDITADPRIATTTKTIEMYYYNPICHNYTSTKDDTYDVNGDGNKEEKVGYSSTSISLIAPSNLLTSQTATDFNDEKTEVIAPNIADIDKTVKVDKEDETRTAKVNINITNNYSNTISEVKIVGKIPYKGNTYLLNKNDLGSEYNTTMKQEGIVIPEDMKDYVTVYYSEKENVTEDINASKNAWTTEPEDMSKVKSFLIDLGDYVMPVNNVKVFTYTIQIPKGIPYNAIAYSEHAVYYCLDTDQGKLRTQTEPNKLGFRIAEKYNLEITKYETNTEKAIQGVVFNVKDVETEVEKTATTNNEGKAILKNLYVEKEYILKEIKTNSNYVLDETETRIKGHIVDGKLEIEIIDKKTNFKDAPQIEETENTNTKVNATIENEVKYNFELNKIDVETSEPIKGIKFELTDYNGKARRYTTSKEGKLSIKLLEPNKQYTLTEVDSKGHYLKDPVTFMMVRDENKNLKFNILAGDLDALPVIDQAGEVPVVKTELTNEKIPTYSLKITKKEKDTENTLKGAQFKLTGENKSDTTLYTTDENGIIQIDNLYEYVEGKNVTGEYTLQEIYPSEGYVLDDTPIIFKAQRDATNNLIFELQNGKIRENLEDIQVDYTNPENPIINITVDNNPIFTLTKVDANTGEPLEGVGFEIKDMNDNYVRDANGNLVGIKELGKINLYSTGNYAWTQNEDGTWQSGNYNVHSTTSTLTSEEFIVSEKGIISFDWSVSSQAASYDYLYYTITNLKNNTTIGGTTTKIGGTSYGIEYDNLKYTKVEQEIEPGRYKIEFRYYKNSSTNTGLDRGFVKNILLINKEKTVKTDNNGKIRLSLREGLYKAIETKPLEGYAQPELYTGIGIGASRPSISNGFDLEYSVGENAINYNDLTSVENGIITVSDNGIVAMYDFNGNAIWENVKMSDHYTALTAVNDGVIAVSENGQVVKYDLEGNIVWRNVKKRYRYSNVITVKDGIIAMSGSLDESTSETLGQVVKYDFNGNVVWENTERTYNYLGGVSVTDGVILVGGRESNDEGYTVKYDLEGNIVWEGKKINSINRHTGITLADDGLITIGSYFQYTKIVKYDFEGNILSSKFEEMIKGKDVVKCEDGIIIISQNGDIIKYDFNINKVWKISNNKKYRGITTINDGFVVVAYDGEIEKYDFNGNKLWENIDKLHKYYSATKTDDSIVAVGTKVTNYDFNGNKLWENTEKKYNFLDVAVVDDGIIAVGGKSSSSYSVTGDIVKYDFNGNIVWENTERKYQYKITTLQDGYVVIGYDSSNFEYISKYDFDGNIIWENKSNKYSSYADIFDVGDGIIAVSSYGQIIKYDYDGNIILENTEKKDYYTGAALVNDGIIMVGYRYTNNRHMLYLLKCDLEGKIIWSKEEEVSKLSNTYSYRYKDVSIVKDGIVAIGYDEYSDEYCYSRVVKYDFEGNKVYARSKEKYAYKSVISLEDGIIAVGEGKVVKYKNHIVEPEITSESNVIVENELIQYKITTKVDGIGGKITGMSLEPYEEVVWKHDSVKNIVATPESGYKVQQITVNGKPIDFTENEDGTVTIEKFICMTEDKEIVVSFVKKNTSLIVNKVDSINNNPLTGAIFNVRQIENREEPVSEQVLGDIVNNGEDYYYTNKDDEVNEVLGELVANNEQYHFVANESGGYESNNKGVASTTANSYIEVDLTDYEGKYALVVNANVSSNSSHYGYATVNNSTTAPSYNNSTGRFIYISGNYLSVTTPRDYTKMLDGGQKYYLHLGYYRNSSSGSGEDKFTVNSIKLYNTTTNTFNFVDNGNGGYESNNQGQAGTVANSYIPIDLTNYEGKYNLIVNANVSSQSGYDYGYATVTDNTTAPTYGNSTGRIIYISGTSTSVTTPKDYSMVLDGGKMYYLHLGYRKYASTDIGEDKFTVNSVRLTLNTSDFLPDTEITTNSSGEAVIVLEDGKKYQINEVQAPTGYTLNPEPIIYDFTAGEGNEITVTNRPQVDLIVHHYIKGTTTPVAEDEYIKGDLGKEYSTSPKTDLTDYRVVTKEDGSYDLPENASGLFQEETQVVTYYYELKPLKLIVHHYIYETEDKLVDDEISEGVRGQGYTTNPLTYPTLNEWYELVEEKRPENANGTLNELVTEVTYYYKLKEHKITTEVQGIGGKISGQNEDAYEKVPHEKDSIKDIIVTPDEGFEVTQITVNGEPITFTPNKDGKVILNKFIAMSEDKHIVVTFGIEHMDYVVTKVWEDGSNAGGNRPESIEIELFRNGSISDSKIVTKDNKKNIKVEEEPSFVNTEGQTYPWTQNEDGTWQSGNYNVNSSTSTLTSEEMNFTYKTAISFDWSVSSQGTSYDYLYYTITNLDTNGTIGGTSKKIGGTSYGTQYDSLKYNTVTVNVNPGRYKIEFKYYKNGSTNTGLDRGFVKNVKYNYEYLDPNKWEAVFEDLPVVDDAGEKITYTVSEKEVNPDELFMYNSRMEYEDREARIINNIEVPDTRIDILATKVWQDNDNTGNTRPSQIKLLLKDGDNIVSEIVIDTLEGNTQTYTFANVRKYDEYGRVIDYTVEEQEINEGELKYYVSSIDNETNTITNTFTIPKKNISVRKKWEDESNNLGKRPESIKLELYGNGEYATSKVISTEDRLDISKELELDFSTMSATYPWSKNADGTWQSGNYNVHNTTSVLTSDEFELKKAGELLFEWSVSSESASYDYLYYTITNLDKNTTTGGTSTKIGGTSYGTVYNNLKFNTVKVNLQPGRYKIAFSYRKDGSANSGLDRGYVRNIKYIGTIQNDDEWITTFENIPTITNRAEDINYTIVEKEVNSKDLALYTSNIEYNENVTEAIVTNTFNIPDTKIDVVATKKWEDNSNENNLRPSRVKLLLKNGDTIIQEQVIDTASSDEQTYTFTDLREYDEQGNEIVYTIDEVEVNEGDLKFYSKTIDNENHIVTNTFTVPEDKISLEVTKIWQDNNNENHVRPSKLKLQAKNGDIVVQEQIVDVTESNEQKYTFENLMKYNSQGQEIEYTVDEAEVNEKDLAGYTKSVEGNVITNTINTYRITTQVNGVGGNITGKEDNPYESVVHGANSIKDITVTPEESYEISKITINEVEQTLPDIKDQEYTLPKFTNMTEDKHIVVEFKKKEYQITTEVEGIGGTISGQEDEIYETVIHGESSVKDIIVTPNKGYKITSITVNGEELTFTALEDGTYTLDKFNVVTENKHIVVKFESKETSIVIRHVTEEGTNLCDPETVEGVVGDEYETSSKEFEEYELKTTPDNAEGVMKEEQIEIIYVYSLVKGKITITKVDNKDNSIKLSGARFKIEKLDKAGNVDVAFTALEKETNSEGIIELNDLRVGTYEITEIEAPEGYELSKKAEKVEITKSNKEISITIKNKEKLELPVTGAINYAIGISIIGLAIVAISVILHKRKSL